MSMTNVDDQMNNFNKDTSLCGRSKQTFYKCQQVLKESVVQAQHSLSKEQNSSSNNNKCKKTVLDMIPTLYPLTTIAGILQVPKDNFVPERNSLLADIENMSVDYTCFQNTPLKDSKSPRNFFSRSIQTTSTSTHMGIRTNISMSSYATMGGEEKSSYHNNSSLDSSEYFNYSCEDNSLEEISQHSELSRLLKINNRPMEPQTINLYEILKKNLKLICLFGTIISLFSFVLYYIFTYN